MIKQIINLKNIRGKSMQIEKFSQKMSDDTEIYVNRWIPENEENIKAVVVLSHGMLEHALRYDRIGSEFAEHGYVFSAHDHRGHGKTAYNAEAKGNGLFGKLADKNGFEKVTSDLGEIIEEVKQDYPGKKIILLGHSFGSFIAQNFIEEKGSEIDACILCGTSGPNSQAGFGKFLMTLACLIHGKNYKSKFCQKLAFSGYNSHFKNEKDILAWLSKSEANRMMYKNDSWCGGIATVSFFRDLSTGLLKIHKNRNIKKIPKELPLFAIYGSQDPVGNYGKSIEKLLNIYRKNGIKNVSSKVYNDDRHEILNENDGEQVLSDIFNWIEKNVAL